MDFKSWCMACCQTHHPIMLSTYCLRALRCDRCARVSDLAMVMLRKALA